MTQLHNLWFSG